MHGKSSLTQTAHHEVLMRTSKCNIAIPRSKNRSTCMSLQLPAYLTLNHTRPRKPCSYHARTHADYVRRHFALAQTAHAQLRAKSECSKP